jgi:hypothetical protein
MTATGFARLIVELEPVALEALAAAARRRNLTLVELITALFSEIIRCDLVDSILDDEDDDAPEAQA